MLDLNLAGEFIVMAATLSLIKSRMLLPEEDQGNELEDDEGNDPRRELVKQLLAYKKFKDAADSLLQLEQRQQNIFPTSGDPLISEEDMKEEKSLEEICIFDLIDAFNVVLSRAPVESICEIDMIKWTVPDKIDMILELTKKNDRVAFSSLFSKESPRGEIIVTFLALLELLRLRQIKAVQNSAFTEIEIIKNVNDGSMEPPPPIIGGFNDTEF